jgi:hypothetical protein
MTMVAISADGTQVAYFANQRLFLRSMSDVVARPLPGAETDKGGNIGIPVFSPDSQSIAYWVRSAGDAADLGTIKRVRLQGGPPVTIAEVRRPLGMSWSGDDILVGQPPPNGIIKVPANGGMPTQIVSAKADELMQGRQLLPGGDAVLFTIGLGTGTAFTGDDTWTKSQVVVQSLESRERKTLIQRGTDARYLPTGHLLYAGRRCRDGESLRCPRAHTEGPPFRSSKASRRPASARSQPVRSTSACRTTARWFMYRAQSQSAHWTNGISSSSIGLELSRR